MMTEFHRAKSGTILEESSKSEEDLTEMTKQSIQTTVSSTAPRFMPVNTLEDVQVRYKINLLLKYISLNVSKLTPGLGRI